MSRIHDDLNIKLPIWNAGMGTGIAGPKLCAAVSNARGLGVLGAGGLGCEEIQAKIAELKRYTSRAFGVNILLPLIQSHEIETCFDERIPLLILFWGDPAPYVADAGRRGIKILAQCGSTEEAVAAADAGVDGVVIQGNEAGGHVKATSRMQHTLNETTRELGSLPVIAAGGIATGSDIAQALLAGASAVSMGTRFLATAEAMVSEAYKQCVVTARAEDTVVTQLFDVGWPNAPHRVLRNKTFNDWEGAGQLPSGSRHGENDIIGLMSGPTGKTEIPRYSFCPPLLNVHAALDDLALYAGESCERVNDVQSTEELMIQLHNELRTAMA